MLRWGKRTLIGLCGLLIVAVLTGVTYQWIATRNELSATPPPGTTRGRWWAQTSYLVQRCGSTFGHS